MAKWHDVEVELAMWCCFREDSCKEVSQAYDCNCPSQDLLQDASPKALQRLSDALKMGKYTGNWEELLGLQIGSKEPDPKESI
jgi:hypothetical protein